jgi:hypothetical protein
VNWFASVAVRLALCGALTAVAYRALGAIAFALCAPLFGVALANPIMQALGQLPRAARLAKYHGFEGRYYEHKGRQVVVHEDFDRFRWLEVNNIRKLVPDLPVNARLAALHGKAFVEGGKDQGPLIRAEELVAQLSQINQPEALRLRTWLEKEVVIPASKLRSRGRAHPPSKNAP